VGRVRTVSNIITDRVDCGVEGAKVQRCQDVMYSQGYVLNGPPGCTGSARISLNIAHVNTITNSVRATDKDKEKTLRLIYTVVVSSRFVSIQVHYQNTRESHDLPQNILSSRHLS
jgi:hypothetical protein